MNKFRISALIFLNIILTPIYIFLFMFCFFIAWTPAFPARTALQNIKNRLDMRGVYARYFVARVLLNYFFYFFEAFVFDVLKISQCSFPKDYDLEKTLTEIKRIYNGDGKNREIVYILGHMANVEMYVPPVLKIYQKERRKIYALAKPSRWNIANKMMLWYREGHGLGILWTDNGVFRLMDKMIDEGHAMVMLVDQKPKIGGLFIEFFGKFSAFPTSGLKFCLNREMIVTYSSAQRIIPGWQRIFIRSGKNTHLAPPLATTLKYVNGDDLKKASLYAEEEGIAPKSSSVAEEMCYFAAWFEEEIRKNPTQWCWDYRKWSREPS
jgi:lauroyl/myristoyl acyltransferase